MAFICNKPKSSCASCEHYRYDSDSGHPACWGAYDLKHPKKREKRNVVVMLEVDDTSAEEAGYGTIDYLETVMSILSSSGVIMKQARILDNDDEEDRDFINAANQIFEE